MSTYNSSSQSSVFSSINTTPLVDVMLVLLIIFMIAAPIFTHKVDFNLPTKGPDQRRELKPPLKIAVAARGLSTAYALDGVDLDATTLVLRLREALAADPEQGFVLSASADLGYDQVSKALVLLRHGGLTRGSFEMTDN